MIKTIDIHNFKSIHQLTLELGFFSPPLRKSKPQELRLSEHFMNGAIGGLPKKF
ncbi:MAG: hypothetical protein RIS64_2588 [Bacteroidota bacterium]|jgi:AAA15 family ATPase/GTPase